MSAFPGGPSAVITGAAGFIGSRLAARLIGGGARVIAVDDPRHFEDRPEIVSIYREAPPAEILDMKALPERLEKSASGGVSGIIHLGACTDTKPSTRIVYRRMEALPPS